MINDFLHDMLKSANDLEKSSIDHTLNVAYNKNPNCGGIDFYGASSLAKSSPVFAFIHGGYWIVRKTFCLHSN